MEVHAHTHSAPTSGGAARKKWTHYFWKFLMLFPAVTLGFFVENQREHYIEHQRARIFDFRFNTTANNIVRKALYENFNPSAIDSFIQTNLPLLTSDKIIFNEYAELCRSRNLRQQLK
jgi:hypothetical protein